MTDTDRMLSWLREAMDAAEQTARKAAELCGCHPPAPRWLFGDEPTDGRIAVVDDPHPDLKRKIGRRWNGSYEGLAMAEHIARHDPAAVLRRIAADRKLLDDLKRVVKGDYIDDGELPLAEHVIRGIAEGYGWTETRSTPGWPECMCTASGECGNCWEKRQGAPTPRSIGACTRQAAEQAKTEETT